MSQVAILLSGDSVSNYHLLNQLRRGDRSFSWTLCSAVEKLRQRIESGFQTESFSIERNFFPLGTWDINKQTKIPFLPVDRLISDIEKEEIKSIFLRVLESGCFTDGPYIGELEAELNRFMGVENAVLCSSGTDALIVGLYALGVEPGDEVIIPGNSFAATENAVLACHAIPILADVSPDDYTLEVGDIRKRITNKTRVIIPVHLYGKLAKMRDIKALADQHGLYVFEDACQSIGATGVGKWSHMAALSFNPYKNFSVLGKAGAVCTNDSALAERCRSFSYHGFDPGRKNIKINSFGFNSRIDNLQAAVALSRLPYVGLNNFKRLYLAYRYCEKLMPLVSDGWIKTPKITAEHVWHLFTIEVLRGDRQSLCNYLHREFGVQTEINYPVLTHMQSTPARDAFYKNLSLKVTEDVHRRLLQLPLYSNITLEEQDQVIKAIFRYFRYS